MTQQHITGLTPQQVAESRAKHGANVLTPPEKEPLWKQFLEKFTDPLIIILMIAGALSIGISLYEHFGLGKGPEVFFEPVGIFVAIFLATGLAFYFELQADKEFTILNQVNDDEMVEVIRDGNATHIARPTATLSQPYRWPSTSRPSPANRSAAKAPTKRTSTPTPPLPPTMC